MRTVVVQTEQQAGGNADPGGRRCGDQPHVRIGRHGGACAARMSRSRW